MDDNTIPSILFLAALHLMLILTIATFLVWQLVRLWLGKVKDRAEKLIAAGVTAFIFPSVFYQAFIIPVFSIISNLEQLFYLFLRYNLADDKPAGVKMQTTEHFEKMSILFSPIIKSFPLAGLLEILAVMVVIYYLAKQITGGHLTLPKVFINGSKNINPRILILNCCISFCLLFSIYFVISVCVTIPYLNEMKKPSGFTQRMVDSTLNVMSKADSIQAKPIQPVTIINFTKDSLIADAVIKAKFSALSVGKQNSLLSMVNAFQNDTKLMLQNRADQIRKINDFYSDYKNSTTRTKGELSRTFQTNSTNIAIDKNALYKDIIGAYENYLSLYNQNYTDAIEGISRADAANSVVNSQMIGNFKTSIVNLLKDTTNNYYNFYYGNSNYQSYSDLIRTSNLINIANYERNGSDWGPLGWSAGYLIRTKSLDLVLLVGMIGFGILGASILSFSPMNDFFQAFGHKAMIKNFPNVLARGFGAALIIYMATKGGLAIFTMGASQDPNGYILLLTCFVGAVFSEKVWAKVSNNSMITTTPAQGQQGQAQQHN